MFWNKRRGHKGNTKGYFFGRGGTYVLFRVPLFVEIPEGALDKFRGGAEEFIAGTRVFPPKSQIGVAHHRFLATATLTS